MKQVESESKLPDQGAGRNPKLSALVGFLHMLPFVAMNAIVGNRVEPFFSIIRPDTHTSAFEYFLLAIVLILLPTGAFIALRPSLRREADGKRRLYFVNGAAAALLLLAFTVLSIGLGSDIYRCDILQLPNCD